MKCLHHVTSLDGGEAVGGHGKSGMVVEEVQDLDRTAIGELPRVESTCQVSLGSLASKRMRRTWDACGVEERSGRGV
jgi:hypothetical protein